MDSSDMRVKGIAGQAVAKLPEIQQFREGKRLRVLLLRVVMWLIPAGGTKEEGRIRRLELKRN